jgi:hypothetical protein
MSNPASEPDDAKMLVKTHGPADVRAPVPTEVRDLLGKPPLLATEDQNEYEALLAELAHEVKPSDVIEWLWVKDVADLTWEIIRYRRIKAAYVNGQFRAELAHRLPPAL